MRNEAVVSWVEADYMYQIFNEGVVKNSQTCILKVRNDQKGQTKSDSRRQNDE